MKLKTLSLAVLIAVTGCSSTKNISESDFIRNQKLSTTFKQDSIKIETDCSWFTIDKSKCEIIAIESTASTATNGNTDSNRRTALTRADMIARANIRYFIQEEINGTKFTSTVAKNVEKANDRIKSKVNSNQEVSMSEEDAAKDNNYILRENSNDTAYQLRENIRINAQGILRGFKVIKQEVTGPQEVTVTIRWDKDSERASDFMRRKFSN